MQTLRNRSLLTIAIELSNANPEMNAAEVISFLALGYEITLSEAEVLEWDIDKMLSENSKQLILF